MSATGKKDHQAIAMDEYLRSENDQLIRRHREMDEMLDQGSGLMTSIRSQRESLNSIRSKNLDIKNVLTMSQTVMRLIHKRISGDKLILFGGMIAFTVFMVLVWKFLL
jgi:Golgi SNAP receptor complex protein 2